MNKRIVSPRYPSMPLGEAIEITERIFTELRTSAVDRDVAAKTMGYTGVTGRSGKVLSNLIQFGLLEKAGKNEVRVSQRAVEILHPDSKQSQAIAVREAAYLPKLFQELRDRFDEGVLSESAIRSYLLKKGFTDAALQPAIKAYIGTYQFAQQFSEYDSHRQGIDIDEESEESQQVKEATQMEPSSHPISQPSSGRNPANHSSAVAGVPRVTMADEGLELSAGKIRSIEELNRLIRMLNAGKVMLEEKIPDRHSEPNGKEEMQS